MQVIEESGLQFRFPANWGVRKYDDHRFYKGLSGAGLKAVDFIVLPPDGTIWLIEVKNYQPLLVHEHLHTPKIKTSEELADALTGKMRDTLRAIHVIHLYYRRKWLYRLAEPLLQRWPHYRSDWVFWTEAAQRAAMPTRRNLLLWLELPPGKKKYRTRVFSTVELAFATENIELHTGGSGYNPLVGMEVS